MAAFSYQKPEPDLSLVLAPNHRNFCFTYILIQLESI